VDPDGIGRVISGAANTEWSSSAATRSSVRIPKSGSTPFGWPRPVAARREQSHRESADRRLGLASAWAGRKTPGGVHAAGWRTQQFSSRKRNDAHTPTRGRNGHGEGVAQIRSTKFEIRNSDFGFLAASMIRVWCSLVVLFGGFGLGLRRMMSRHCPFTNSIA